MVGKYLPYRLLYTFVFFCAYPYFEHRRRNGGVPAKRIAAEVFMHNASDKRGAVFKAGKGVGMYKLSVKGNRGVVEFCSAEGAYDAWNKTVGLSQYHKDKPVAAGKVTACGAWHRHAVHFYDRSFRPAKAPFRWL